MNIDLHCHTKVSDGTCDIHEIIAMAKCRSIDILAITDHDTFKGNNQAAFLGHHKGIKIVVGVEISAYDYQRKRKVHVLCYEPKYPQLLNRLLRTTVDQRRSVMNDAIQKICKRCKIPLEMILARAKGSTNIYKQHVMHALIDAGYTNELFGDTFQELFHPVRGFAKVNIEYPDVFKVLEEVRIAGGIAVLAHPEVYDSFQLMEELCEKHLLMGLERNHPHNSLQSMKIIKDYADKYQLFVTGGTDFHGGYSSPPFVIGTYLTDDSEYYKMNHVILE